MRITNSMISNSTLININRNMRFLNNISQQIASTKKIGVPSDDPIIASRALKFRTSVAETQQFRRNVASGLSWMEVSEAALIDVNENLMQRFESLFTEGATGTEEYSDKMAIISSVKELVDQMGLDMNQTYAGRYVFSGFRTDEPAVLIEDNADKSFVITQEFNLQDIEKAMSYQKDGTVGNEHKEPVSHPINVIKLAYNNVDFDGSVTKADGNPFALGVFGPGGTPEYNVVEKSFSDADAYTPPDNTATSTTNTIHYIKETGELVMGDNVANAFKDGTTVSYQKEGFKKGDLNPVVYFDCMKSEVNATTGNITTTNEYNMDSQEIQYEFATNTYITVNTLAKETYTDKMYADFKRLIEFAESLKISDEKKLEEYYSTENDPQLTGEDLKNAVSKQISKEKALLNDVLHDRFNNMLSLLSTHSATAMDEHTKMGSRMLRLDLLSSRLEEDESTYTKLMSENEDTEMEYAIMQKANAEMMFQAALKANSNIMQLSLANYI